MDKVAAAAAKSRQSCQTLCNPRDGTRALVGKFFTTAAKSFQSCPTLCNPIDGSATGSPVPGILQARTLAFTTSAT